MKKIISLVLTLIMLISFAVPVFAETNPDTGELYEEFTFNFASGGFDAKVETDNFILEASWHYKQAVSCGGGEHIKIIAKANSGLVIKRVEARVYNYGGNYKYIDVTAGEKREQGGINLGGIAHVDNIGKSEISFVDGQGSVDFDMVRVYYYEETHEHIWGENEKCEICQALKCEITGEHKAVCFYCGKELSSGNTTASVFSDGNLTILCTVVAAAVFGLGGFLLGKKKKPLLSDSILEEGEE